LLVAKKATKQVLRSSATTAMLFETPLSVAIIHSPLYWTIQHLIRLGDLVEGIAIVRSWRFAHPWRLEEIYRECHISPFPFEFLLQLDLQKADHQLQAIEKKKGPVGWSERFLLQRFFLKALRC
jgi:hypothetical protein